MHNRQTAAYNVTVCLKQVQSLFQKLERLQLLLNSSKADYDSSYAATFRKCLCAVLCPCNTFEDLFNTITCTQAITFSSHFELIHHVQHNFSRYSQAAIFAVHHFYKVFCTEEKCGGQFMEKYYLF